MGCCFCHTREVSDYDVKTPIAYKIDLSESTPFDNYYDSDVASWGVYTNRSDYLKDKINRARDYLYEKKLYTRF